MRSRVWWAGKAADQHCDIVELGAVLQAGLWRTLRMSGLTVVGSEVPEMGPVAGSSRPIRRRWSSSAVLRNQRCAEPVRALLSHQSHDAGPGKTHVSNGTLTSWPIFTDKEPSSGVGFLPLARASVSSYAFLPVVRPASRVLRNFQHTTRLGPSSPLAVPLLAPRRPRSLRAWRAPDLRRMSHRPPDIDKIGFRPSRVPARHVMRSHLFIKRVCCRYGFHCGGRGRFAEEAAFHPGRPGKITGAMPQLRRWDACCGCLGQAFSRYRGSGRVSCLTGREA